MNIKKYLTELSPHERNRFISTLENKDDADEKSIIEFSKKLDEIDKNPEKFIDSYQRILPNALAALKLTCVASVSTILSIAVPPLIFISAPLGYMAYKNSEPEIKENNLLTSYAGMKHKENNPNLNNMTESFNSSQNESVIAKSIDFFANNKSIGAIALLGAAGALTATLFAGSMIDVNNAVQAFPAVSALPFAVKAIGSFGGLATLASSFASFISVSDAKFDNYNENKNNSIQEKDFISSNVEKNSTSINLNMLGKISAKSEIENGRQHEDLILSESIPER